MARRDGAHQALRVFAREEQVEGLRPVAVEAAQRQVKGRIGVERRAAAQGVVQGLEALRLHVVAQALGQRRHAASLSPSRGRGLS